MRIAAVGGSDLTRLRARITLWSPATTVTRLAELARFRGLAAGFLEAVAEAGLAPFGSAAATFHVAVLKLAARRW
jgi:hypothetical protein